MPAGAAGFMPSVLAPDNVQPGSTAIARAIGCTACVASSPFEARYGIGKRTCVYLVCTKIGNFSYCQLVQAEEPCGSSAVLDILGL